MTRKLLKKPDLSRRQKILVPVGIILLLAAGMFGVMKFYNVFHETPPSQATAGTDVDEIENTGQPPIEEVQPEPEPPTPKPTTKPETAGPTEGVGTLSWVVNKRRPLNPKSYVPPNLVFPNVTLRVPGNESMKIRADVGTAIEQLFAAASGAGHSPMLSSGYRSYSYQVSLYNSYVKSQGQAEADKQSARPGYSEHQTGLAFDICNAGNCKLEQAFGSTPFGQWVAVHAHEYGFIIRYPSGKQSITGYIYEPWHLRYLGTDTATQVYNSGKTLEEFYGLPAAPDYL